MTPPADDELERFVRAQDGVYEHVVNELRQGRKTTHWMWFVFPQLRGLGHSPMATRYGLASAGEALLFWQHPVLGRRLRECTELVLAVENRTAYEIFGSPDDMKLRSCMTLFNVVAPEEAVFENALTRFFQGVKDERTLELLAA
jgi:uncharacterized protein (DUF1810 family)